jgi:asparagine synthase (glutamine-hydrolysing)
MCGITGVFHYRDRRPADAALLERQTLAIRHRGPDDADVWSSGPVALGHRRLSIVDLSPAGHQPMPNEDGTLHVTYNGEIYNWPELQPRLAARGHRFRGHSDTEALLHLYEDHGDALLDHLVGMFAFALWDERRQRLLIARDRLGIKPLYWHDDGRRIVFASELKALLLDPSVPRDVDPVALGEYLVHQYVPSPRTILAGVRKLPPGHSLVVDAHGIQERRWWWLPVTPQPVHDPAQCARELHERLTEAVRIRLLADVPLGAFLSGGIDSSAVVALMSQVTGEPVKTFSIGFEEQDFSELEHARRVARHLGTDHHEFVVRPDALGVLPRLVWQADEPFADASIIPTHHVCEMARRHVTVALSGDGGDEAYGGYVTYPFARDYARVDRVPHALRRLAATPARLLHPDHPLGRKLRRLPLGVLDRHLEAMSFFVPSELGRLATPGLSAALRGHDPYRNQREHFARAAHGGDEIAALLHVDAMTYMADDVLMKVDKASMLHSLEVRVPLLDHRVLEYVAGIPFEYKLRGAVGKWILRESVRDLLPPDILARGKQGFAMPIDRWLGGAFGALARDVLSDARARGRGWFDAAAVTRVLDDPAQRPERRARQTWALVCLELWARTYLDRGRDELSAPLAPFGRESVAA